MLTPFDTAVFAQIAVVTVSSVTALTGLGVAVHAYVQRTRQRAARLRAPLADERLRHLEQAVDAIAVEVERVSEGQRFLVKLQAERQDDAALRP